MDAATGDTATVDVFARNWLDMRESARWREAVKMALMGDWVHVLGDGGATDTALRALFRRHTATEHERLQPLWERKVSGRHVDPLETPLGDGLTLRDLAVDTRQVCRTQVSLIEPGVLSTQR